SSTVNVYVPYPRLRVRLTSEQVHRSLRCMIRRCSAPAWSTKTFSGLYGLGVPPRSLATKRTLQVRPLKLVKNDDDFFWPWVVATADTGPPGSGIPRKVAAG